MNRYDAPFAGRLVRMDQLLVQPRVHLSWMLKSRALCFELTAELAQAFYLLWLDYLSEGCPPPARFLSQYSLTEQDQLFALFCSAWYLNEQGCHILVQKEADSLYWFMD